LIISDEIAKLERHTVPVMWSETVRLRIRPVSDQKKSVLVLVLQVWCCVAKDDHVTLVVIMILKNTATFQVLFIVFRSVLGTSLLWRSTVAFT